MAKNTFTDKDTGYETLMTQFKSKGKSVFVGFLRGGQDHKPKDGGETMSMATLAAIHEFGSPARGIPSRSFMRSVFDTAGSNKIDLFIRKLLKAIGDKQLDETAALGGLGAFTANMMRQKIQKGLKPALKRRKGKPLYDTGQLIGAIDYEVVEAKK